MQRFENKKMKEAFQRRFVTHRRRRLQLTAFLVIYFRLLFSEKKIFHRHDNETRFKRDKNKRKGACETKCDVYIVGRRLANSLLSPFVAFKKKI